MAHKRVGTNKIIFLIVALSALATLAVVVGLVALVYFDEHSRAGRAIRFEWSARKLPQRLEEARKAGVPLVASDVVSKEEQEGDDELQEALLALSSSLTSEGSDAHLGKRIQDQVRTQDFATARASMEQLEKPLNRLRAAVAAGLEFPQVDPDLSLAVMDFDLEKIARDACRLLAFSSRLHAEKRDWTRALSDLQTAFDLAAEVGDQPYTIPKYAETSCRAYANYAAQAGMTYGADQAGILLQYRQILEANPPKDDALQIISGDAYTLIAGARNWNLATKYEDFDSFREAYPDGYDHVVKRSGEPEGTEARAYMSEVLGMTSEMFRKLDVRADPEAEAAEMDSIVKKWVGPKGTPGYIIQALGADPVTDLYEIALERRAIWEATIALSDVLIYKNERGSFPSSLEEAGVKSKDPLTGEAYGYLVEDNQVRVYTVGRDRKDDNGMAKRELTRGGEEPESWDLAAASPPIP